MGIQAVMEELAINPVKMYNYHNDCKGAFFKMREYKETGTYTTNMEETAFDLDPEQEDYRERLLEVAASFRPFQEVLKELIFFKGYQGRGHQLSEMIAFTEEQFKASKVPIPRNLESFFTGEMRFERDRKTPFLFCFAFRLSLEETEVFFRRCCFGRGLDFHSLQDFVFGYALREQLSYQEACSLLEKAKIQTEGGLLECNPACGNCSAGEYCAREHSAGEHSAGDCFSEGRLYTRELEETFHQIHSEEELLLFLQQQADQFSRNNKTAQEKVTQLWERITASPEGYLIREEKLVAGLKPTGTKMKNSPYTNRKKWSEEGALKRILGLETSFLNQNGLVQRKEQKSDGQKLYFSGKRSLVELVKENPLLHPVAAACFPGRNSLRLILKGKKVSYESLRKWLILLLFYTFWIKGALDRGDRTLQARPGEGERCQNYMDRHLMEAGYPCLYYGNPYDWLFLFCMFTEEPLPVLRDFMLELYLEKQEQKDKSISDEFKEK